MSEPARIVFVHGRGRFGAAAWPIQHRLAGTYDCLFLKRTGFDVDAEPVPTDFDADARIVSESLGDGGHIVAHADGAVAAMMAALAWPGLVRSLTLIEPECLSLTRDLPATEAHIGRLQPVIDRRDDLSDAEYREAFDRALGETRGGHDAGAVGQDRAMSDRRLRLQAPPWTAALDIVPGVPTLVVTGGWEPLYEEVAEFLATTGARHITAPGGHRPQDTEEGHELIATFIGAVRGQTRREDDDVTKL